MPNYTESINKYSCGDLITITEFCENVEVGMFIDYDGFGFLVKDNLVDSSMKFYPSSAKFGTFDATHIIWFNR